MNLRSLLCLCEGNVLFEEITGEYLKWSSCLHLSSIATCSGSCDQCRLFEDCSSLSAIHFLVVVDLRLNYDIVLVEEIELRDIVPTWSLVSVVCNDSLSDLSIILGIFFIQHDEEEIKTREKRVWKSDVATNWLISSIFTIDRVSSSDHTTAGVQTHVDTSLSDCYSLLLHYFVNSHSVNIVHLIELIDTDDTSIS